MTGSARSRPLGIFLHNTVTDPAEAEHTGSHSRSRALGDVARRQINNAVDRSRINSPRLGNEAKHRSGGENLAIAEKRTSTGNTLSGDIETVFKNGHVFVNAGFLCV